MKHDQRYLWLDLVRGAAAMTVCAGHLRAATLIDFSNIPDPSSVHKIFYFITGLGHQAVVVFFVLSGFFVGGSVISAHRKFDITDYLVARLTRLWIVLIPALVLTFIIDSIISVYAPEVFLGTYRPIWNSGPDPSIGYSRSPLAFFGNVLFLQTIAVPVFGSNGPLWSLANEFWYYMIFPLLVAASRGLGASNSVSNRCVSGALAALLLVWLPSEIVAGLPLWLLGVVVISVSSRAPRNSRPVALVATLVIFFASLCYSKSGSWQEIVHVPVDVAVAVGFAPLCGVLGSWPAPTSKVALIVEGSAQLVSDFSYSLYLGHFPVVLAISVFCYGAVKVTPDRLGFVFFAGWYCLLLVVGVGLWYLFERHTAELRRLIIGRLRRTTYP